MGIKEIYNDNLRKLPNEYGDVSVMNLLNLWMDLVDILPDVRCGSEVLSCTILTHISDPEVKIMDFHV